MLDFIIWWLTASILALAAFPIAFRLLGCLPDRGYAAAKPLSLLLCAYLFWIGGTLGLTGNERGSVLLVVLLLLLAGLAVGARQRRALGEYAQNNLRTILLVEAIFLAVFAWFTLLRSYAPNIQATEKPFELALLNGVSRTPFFPPTDTWYSGFAMNYYYFGFVNVHVLALLTQTGNGVAFNLATPLTAALAAVTIFGLAYNLVCSLRLSARRAVTLGLAAVGLLLVLSSLEGVLELAAARGLGSAGFYRTIGIQGLPVLAAPGSSVLRTSPAWYPSDAWSFWWWWHATRMGSNWNIMEFPYFSFMLGDLHPHVMVIPFALLALTFTWSIIQSGAALDGSWWKGRLLLLTVYALALGALASLNAWDQPTALLILFLLTAAVNARRLGGWSARVLSDTLRFVVPIAALSVLLLLPFWAIEVFHKPDFTGIAPTLISPLTEPDLRGAMATPPGHLLLFWGPLLWLSFAFLVVHMRRTRALSLPSRYVLWPLALTLLPLLFWLLLATVDLGPGGVGRELAQRGPGLLTEAILGFLVFLALAALMREALPERGKGSALPVVFSLVLVALSLVYLYGAELFYVVEAALPPVRANTVFKFWYQAWILLSLGCAGGVAFITCQWRLRPTTLRPARLAWAAATGVILLAALVYPLTATFSRTDGFGGARSLDGLAYWQQFDPADFAAAQWLAAHARGLPVVLEAEGPPLAGTYSPEGGRISELSGLPTVLAWQDHERQFRNNQRQVNARNQAIRTIYTTTDVAAAQRLLDRYSVRYVVVGQLERQVYGNAGLAKFAQMGAPVYQTPAVTIYDLAAPLPLSGQPAG